MRNPCRRPELFSLLVLPLIAAAVQAQAFVPQVGYVYPAGGRQGTTFQVVVGGQYLDGARFASVSGSGVEAKLLELMQPVTQQEFGRLRQKLQDFRSGTKDAPSEKEIADVRKKLAIYLTRANPAIAEVATVEVTVAADAEPGPRELRLGTDNGLSNPLVFQVGKLPEFVKPRPPLNEDVVNSGRLYRLFEDQHRAQPAPEMRLPALPVVVNGQVLPGCVDRYRFRARKGLHLVAAASCRELVPYLADAVPGWFQATLTLYDADRRELACEGHFRFRPDPVLHCVLPKDGEYLLEIRDSLYRGREDFVYRIALGEVPFVTGLFPLGGPAGKDTRVELEGWNLPATRLTVSAPDDKHGTRTVFVRSAGPFSNRLPFAVDRLPEIREQEPNNDVKAAQPVTLPVIINGRIDTPGDRDVFRFEGKKGQKVVAEVIARRLESPLDSVLTLTDAAGTVVAYNDDHEDRAAGLHTHHADSVLTATLPASGTYYVHLSDAQRQGSPAHAYRLRLSVPRPDFELLVVPSSISARPGAAVPVTVYALRRDGFNDAITLSLKDAPKGFILSGARVPAKQDRIQFTLTVPPTAPERPTRLDLEGSVPLARGKEVRRPAVAADDMMQAFIYHHLVPAQELLVAVAGSKPARAALKLPRQTPVPIPVGGTATIHYVYGPGPTWYQAQLTLSDPPPGITIKKVSHTRGGITVVVQATRKAKPGRQGNLILVTPPKGDPNAARNRQRNGQRLLDTLPAVPFQIVGGYR